MSGHMVAHESGNYRQLFMVRNPDPVKACALVRRMQGNCPTYALAPVSNVTLDYLNISTDMPWRIDAHQCDEIICCGEPE